MAATAATSPMETHISSGCEAVFGSSAQSPMSKPSIAKAAKTRIVYAAPKRRSPYAIVGEAIHAPCRPLFQTAAMIRFGYRRGKNRLRLITSVTSDCQHRGRRNGSFARVSADCVSLKRCLYLADSKAINLPPRHGRRNLKQWIAP